MRTILDCSRPLSRPGASARKPWSPRPRRSTCTPRRAWRRSRGSGDITTSRSSRSRARARTEAQQDVQHRAQGQGADFDDSKWEVIAPETLKNARGDRPGLLLLVSDQGHASRPRPRASRSSSRRPSTTTARSGSTASCPASPGDTGGPIVAGFNVPNRVELKDPRPGKVYQIAVFGINGPISATPSNWIFLGPTFLELVDKK